jgi:hypothetical protein
VELKINFGCKNTQDFTREGLITIVIYYWNSFAQKCVDNEEDYCFLLNMSEYDLFIHYTGLQNNSCLCNKYII